MNYNATYWYPCIKPDVMGRWGRLTPYQNERQPEDSNKRYTVSQCIPTNMSGWSVYIGIQ